MTTTERELIYIVNFSDLLKFRSQIKTEYGRINHFGYAGRSLNSLANKSGVLPKGELVVEFLPPLVNPSGGAPDLLARDSLKGPLRESQRLFIYEVLNWSRVEIFFRQNVSGDEKRRSEMFTDKFYGLRSASTSRVPQRGGGVQD